jgi:hypothetical protein
MEILERSMRPGSQRAAAELVGCDLKTVGRWVGVREQAGGGLPQPVRPRPRVDAFAEKTKTRVPLLQASKEKPSSTCALSRERLPQAGP